MPRGLSLQTRAQIIHRRAECPPQWDTGHTVIMYVSANRWVADCVECGSGIACDPTERSAVCYECGGICTAEAPDDWNIAVRVLEERPVVNRHWLPGETVDQLRAENIEHGFGADLGGV